MVILFSSCLHNFIEMLTKELEIDILPLKPQSFKIELAYF